jgi:hypothetical protein
MKWTAREIARSLTYQVFNHRHLIVVPNTYWPGSETDLLLVRTDLRLMDVEIKISRSDLKADAKKEKWFDMASAWPMGTSRPVTPRTHPRRIWKHYYALPQSIWTDELLTVIQPASGIIIMTDHKTHPGCYLKRQAKPSKDAERISAEDLADIARMQSGRMWDAFDEVDRHRRALEREAATS